MIELLTVCTGNVARSPLAEALLRARLPTDGIHIASAGTRALVGRGMTDEALALVSAHEGDVSGAEAHRARLVTERLLTEPHVVLAMAREHRRQVVELAPARLRTTFTVREFARLAAHVPDAALRETLAAHDDPIERLRQALMLVTAARGIAPPPTEPEDDDVVDPFRRSERTYARAAAQLVPAVDVVARVLRVVMEPSP
ncbi:low molecular weight phosphatase family protein [Microbacterium sp. LRZ72]|uniref:arsenate reductase/protein-tyrosine-phosphatase family protein n=1 Tax=Microbacterium sp. LRZ72 TaxID=2942481 RepID=UPI0029B6A516|nr:low molecular weight phosphatase family protein [Microbacterium sp. LRZ72]MDX2377987.1 low molecular weight phosphatase family protein [Microbacterium sp. LRZ72]